MNIALLVIDIQEAFIGEQRGTKVFEDTMMFINATATLFRQSSKPVLNIRDLEEGNSSEFDNVKEWQKHEQDIEIKKYHSNSFWQTDLDSKLKDLNVDFLVLCGNAAEYCVLATYNGALERGFKSAILQHGVFANHPNGLEFIQLNRPLISYGALSYFIKESK